MSADGKANTLNSNVYTILSQPDTYLAICHMGEGQGQMIYEASIECGSL